MRRFTAGKYAVIYGNDTHHILQIKHQAGDAGVYIGNKTPLSIFSDDEYILPRGINLKLNGKTTLTHNNHTFHIWDVDRIRD